MPSLYTQINNEYINQDELAKRIAFERTISQVNKYYGDEKETSIKPGQLTSQLRYGFDSLFENFRNAVEQVLAEEYNGDLTNQKTYEVIKKYNQLSSYLKNIMNMKQLGDKDQEEIQAKFNELKDKLNLLKKISIDNQFLDSDDIVDMVDKINNVTTDKKQEMKNVPATSAAMVKTLESKTDAEKMINDSVALLDETATNLQDKEIATSKKLSDFKDEFDKISQFFNDPNLDPLEYPQIKTNYDTLKSISTDVSSDIKWFTENRAKIPTYIKEIKDNLKQTSDDMTEFIKKADDRVVDSIDQIKNDEFQKIADEFAEGKISQQESDDQTDDINRLYDAKYYVDYRQKIDGVLNRYFQKLTTTELDPIVQNLAVIETKTATNVDLLALDEDEITDILSELNKLNDTINKVLNVFITNSNAHLDKQPELKKTAPQVERKQKERSKPPKKIKKQIKKVVFQPYVKIGNFAQKYRDSALEFFNQTTQFKQFPAHLFTYITNPGKTKAQKILDRINDIKSASLRAKWGEYQKMSLANQEKYFS